VKINKYIIVNKLLENKTKYPKIHNFLFSKKIDISNVFIVDTPVFNLYYHEHNQLSSKHVSVDEHLTKNFNYSIFNKKYQVFVFPTEDIYDDKLLIHKYEERLRIYYELNNWGKFILLRKNKFERIYGEIE